MGVETWTEKSIKTVTAVTRWLLPGVLVTATVGCDYSFGISQNPINIPTIKQMEELCTTNLILSAYYFKHNSDLRNEDGKPKFKSGVDEIIEPAVERKYQVSSQNGSLPEIFIIGANGFVDRLASEFGVHELNAPSVPLIGRVFFNEQKIKVMKFTLGSLEDLENKREYSVPCGSTIEIAVKVPESMKDFDDFPDSVEKVS